MKSIKISTTLLASAIALALTGCADTSTKSTATDKSTSSSKSSVTPAPAVRASGPAPLAPLGAPPVPADNKQTPEKIALGKKLFFDPRLGGDASISCASCHSPDQGWPCILVKIIF